MFISDKKIKKQEFLPEIFFQFLKMKMCSLEKIQDTTRKQWKSLKKNFEIESGS